MSTRHARPRARARARVAGRSTMSLTGSTMSLVAVAVALALAGCESTQEKSAKLERAAKVVEAHQHAAKAALTVTRASAVVKVASATLLHTSEGAAAVVVLHNTSAHALRTAPIAITVKNAAGRTLFQNDTLGQEPALTTVASLPARSSVVWVDDQVPANGAPVSVSARVGEGTPVAGALPAMTVSGLHLTEDPTNGVGASGNVADTSAVAQQKLVVDVLAERGGQVVAAGRAVLPEAPAHATTSFQVFFVGSPRGATLVGSAQASTTR